MQTNNYSDKQTWWYIKIIADVKTENTWIYEQFTVNLSLCVEENKSE